jgi:drug/metabolite transporter (DMT)-like permease
MFKSVLQKHFSGQSIAISAMLLSALCMALLAVFYRYTLFSMSLALAAWLRMLFPLLCLLPLIKWRDVSLWRNWQIHMLRGLIVMSYIYAVFTYLWHSNILAVTLLSNTGPLFLPFLSRIFLGKRLHWPVVACSVLGFVGVLIAINPSGGMLQWYALLGVYSGLANAGSQICLHHTNATQTRLQNMFGLYFFSSLFLMLPVIYFALRGQLHWQWHASLWLWFGLITGFSFLNQFTRMVAFRWVKNPATVMPWVYFAVPFAGILDWAIFHMLPSWHGVVGAAVIIVSVSVLVRVQRA